MVTEDEILACTLINSFLYSWISSQSLVKSKALTSFVSGTTHCHSDIANPLRSQPVSHSSSILILLSKFCVWKHLAKKHSSHYTWWMYIFFLQEARVTMEDGRLPTANKCEVETFHFLALWITVLPLYVWLWSKAPSESNTFNTTG